MDVPTLVRGMLDAAGYHPPAEEVAELETEYAVLRQMVQMLHAVESARYESPALILDPTRSSPNGRSESTGTRARSGV